MRRLLPLIAAVLLFAVLAPVFAQDAPEPLGDPIAASASLPASARDAALSPDGFFVYALLDDGSLAILQAGASGALAHIAGSPFPISSEGAQATALAIAPDGSRLYIAFDTALSDSSQKPINVFTLDPLTGETAWLGEATVTAAPDGIRDLAVSADGTQLLISGFKNGGLAVFPAPFLDSGLPPGGESLTESFSADTAVEWIQTLYDRVQADAVNAPQASRLYGYAGVALYEAVVNGMPANRSLAGQLNGLTELPLPEPGRVYDWPTAAAASLRTVMSGLMSADSATAFQTLYDEQIAARRDATGDAIVEASAAFGESVGAAILDWANADGFTESRDLNPTYELPTGDSALWVVTTQGRAPVEPFWGSVRPFALSYADECVQPMNAPYSEDPASTFYQQALEVVAVEAALTPEQRAIAEWWVDTPGVTGAPSGHWMRIGGAVIDQLDLNLAQAAEVYGMLGMTLADSFISTWSLKYQVNLLRPVTYIQAFIDPRWQPYIESPSFPEYPSGHSVASAAAADMLTSLYGAVAFTDHTHDDVAESRSFTSFEAAATEAAFSRLYGGIHFRQAIENGMRQGECITNAILGRVAMRQFGQNE
jgi:hypothetical protein